MPIPDPLHPALVHFPIVLALLALLLEAMARHRRGRHLEPAAGLAVALAAMGAVAAVLSGGLAEDEAVVPRAAAALLERHEELGELVMWGLIVLAAVRLLLARMGRFRGWVPYAYLAALALAAAAVAFNGHLGGTLVFDHGIGTEPVQSRRLPEL